MVIRELFAKLGLQVDESAFRAADAAVGALKSGLLGIGAAVAAARVALAGMVKATADYASEVNDLSVSTGLTAENLQVLGYVGKLAGSSMEEVAHGMMHLSRAAYEAATTGGAAGEAFFKLGVQAYDAAGKVKEPNQLLTEIASGLTRITNPTERAALSMQLMGRSGARLTQTLTKFGGNLDEVKKQAVSLGIVLADKTIQAGDQLGDTLDRVNFAIKGVVYAIGAPLLGKVRAMAEGWVRWISVHRQWIALKVHEAIARVSVVMDGLVDLVKQLEAHPVAIKWILGLSAALATLMFPLTAVTVGLAALVEDFALYFKDPKADTLLRSLLEYFEELGEQMNKLGFWNALYTEGEKFATWFAKTVVDAMGRAVLDASLGAPPRPKAGQAVINTQPPSTFGEGVGNLMKHLFGTGPDYSSGIPALPADGTFGRGLGVLAPSGGAQVVFAPIITVEASPGVDGTKVGNDIWTAIEPRADEWLGRKLSDAQGATHR
jgi:hypothetical protein